MKPKTTLLELEKKFGTHLIPYAHLLQTQEWVGKRENIVERDGCRCVRCNTTETEVTRAARNKEGKYNCYFIKDIPKEDGRLVKALMLSPKGEVWFEVHHKFYILGKVPWG